MKVTIVQDIENTDFPGLGNSSFQITVDKYVEPYQFLSVPSSYGMIVTSCKEVGPNYLLKVVNLNNNIDRYIPIEYLSVGCELEVLMAVDMAKFADEPVQDYHRLSVNRKNNSSQKSQQRRNSSEDISTSFTDFDSGISNDNSSDNSSFGGFDGGDFGGAGSGGEW